ncbi:hypothetical protein ACQPXS_01790 [Streptomyces sp. CA-142005]
MALDPGRLNPYKLCRERRFNAGVRERRPPGTANSSLITHRTAL